MKIWNRLLQIYCRLQYPVSLPEDIAKAIGIQATNDLTFTAFIKMLANPHCYPTKLRKFMTRSEVEATFASALRKEHFSSHSLFSYYFNNGWLGFYLQYDQDSKLRRVYVRHKELDTEIKLLQSSRKEETPLGFGFPF